VILPGGERAKESDLPGFRQGTWVEFHRSLDDEAPFTDWHAASRAFRRGANRESRSQKANARTSAGSYRASREPQLPPTILPFPCHSTPQSPAHAAVAKPETDIAGT
jgi:hypothetical protein